MSDIHTPEQRRKNMQAIKGKDTAIEMILRKALWDKGIRYRKNSSKYPGHPDIVINKYKLIIFCDGEFFHGKDWDELEPRLQKSNNSQFWIEKIKRNMARDKEVNEQLETMGYTVLRFWGKDIKKNTDECVCKIMEKISIYKE